MRTILWIVGGILLVSAAFFIPGGAEHIWQSLLFSGIAALLFLVALTFSQSKVSPSNRNIAGVATLILLVLFGIYGWLGYQDAVKHDRQLTNIRKTIEVGIAQNEINEMLLKTLQDSYSTAEGKANIGSIFHQHYDSRLSEGRIDYSPEHDDKTLHIELVKATRDSVILVAYSSFVRGHNADFENYDGQSGHLQTKGTLTAKGISYERKN